MAGRQKEGGEHKTAEYWLQPENLKRIEEWSEKGLIIQDICKNMGINPSTFYRWKSENPEMNAAYQRGKLIPDMIVANAYYKLAHGYTTQEKFMELNEYGEMVVTKIIEREVPPNEKAASTWLKNRNSDFMKDSQLVETQRNKIEAETEYIRAKIKLLEGATKDSGHLNSLVELLDGLKVDK